MSSRGFYFRGLDSDEVNALRGRLNDLAATFGYTAERGPTTGQGNLAEMLMMIDAGELALVLLPDTQYRPALEALDQIAADLLPDNWAESIAASLRAALQRQARYLAALAQYRAVAAQFATNLEQSGQADMSAVDAAREELARWEPSPGERARPIREVSEATGIRARTIRRWVAEDQVWGEKRGKLWYVDQSDVEYCRDTGEQQRGWPLGRPRS